ERITPDSSLPCPFLWGKLLLKQGLSSVFDLRRLRGNADHDVMWFDVTCDHCAGANHRMISDLRPGEHGGVIRDTHAIPDPCRRCVDLVNVVNVVVMRVDVYVIRDRYMVADVDAATIVEQYVTMNDDVVSERQVVTKRPLDKVPALEVLADAAKD